MGTDRNSECSPLRTGLFDSEMEDDLRVVRFEL